MRPHSAASSSWLFQVLGPVEVLHNGQRLVLGARMQRAVLARLLCARGQVVPAERIIDDLWGGDPPPSALSVLQAHISTLRRVLEPDRPARQPAAVLVTRAPGYRLLASTDGDALEQQIERSTTLLESSDFTSADAVLTAALGAVRGDPFADFADEPWASIEANRLNEVVLTAHELRATAAISSGYGRKAVVDLERLTAAHPLRESLWGLLATALYLSGRQADALDTLRGAGAMLSEELGLDLSPSLRELETRILRHELRQNATPVWATARTSSMASHPAEAAPSTAPESMTPPVLYGRDDAVVLLRAATQAAAFGTLRMVALLGEAGIGKTALAQAIALEQAAKGWQIAWGRSRQAAGAPSLWPWRQVLDRLDEPDEANRGRREPVAPDPAAALDVADARFAQHQAICERLGHAAMTRPLMVVLDDLQWADTATMAVLSDLPLLIPPTAPVLVCVTARTDETTPALSASLGELGRQGALLLEVNGLDPAAIGRWATERGHAVDAIRLASRTGGNPFLLAQTFTALDIDGEAALDQMPVGARDLLRQRVDQLPDSTRHVIAAAAVAGRDIDLDLLIAVTGEGEGEVLDALDAAAAAGVVVSEGAKYRFTHDLMLTTVADGLRAARRARLHADILNYLDKRESSDAFTLASHALAAGDHDAGLRWAVAAAEQAEKLLAHNDAAHWWSRAIDQQTRATSSTATDRVQLLLRATRAQLAAGEAMDALASRDAAVRESDIVASPQLTVEALVALDTPTLWVLRRYDDVDLRLVQRLEDAVREHPQPDAARARLLATLANELSYDLDPRQARLADEAYSIAQTLDDPKLLGLTLNARYLALNALGGNDEEIDRITQALFDLDDQHRLPQYALLAHLMLMLAMTERFSLAAADAHAAEAQRLIRRLRQRLPALQWQLWRALRHVYNGAFESAEREVDTVASSTEQWWAFDPLLAATRISIRVMTDRPLNETLVDAIAEVHPAIAHDARLLLQPVTAMTRELPLHRWPPIRRDWLWTSATCLRAKAVAAHGDHAARLAIYDDLLPLRGRIACTGSNDGGPVDYFLGILATSLNRPELARTHFHELEERSRRAAMTWWADRATILAAATATC